MGVCTKTGDDGNTSLFTGQRVEKSSLRVDTYGTIDELNSVLAMARAFCHNMEVKEKLKFLQQYNSLLMTDIASIDKAPFITQKHVAAIESLIDTYENKLPSLTSFLVPGDTKGGAMLDFARTVARRAERMIWKLEKEELVHRTDRLYLNRVSDCCFMLMRWEENQ